jgi:type II secretion system protein N
MRLARVAAVLAGAGVLFAVVLAATFPTDALVRRVLAGVTPPGSLSLDFERAKLRPWGLVLERVALKSADGLPLLAADWIRVRPSLLGFLTGRTGRPWRLVAAGCGGSLQAQLAGDQRGSALTLDWRDLDLARCSPLTLDAVSGQSEGRASLLLPPGARPTGDGSVNVRSARLYLPGRGLPIDTLHADPAFVRWSLGNGRLTLATIEIHGSELKATGSGMLRLAGYFPRSAVDLRLTVTPGASAPPHFRDLLLNLPPAAGEPGARRLVVVGTVDNPRLGR